ncbi:phage tail protein I [Pseudovibrio sp. Tun.PSC04-5.I4]|uniref:phage tail protein I n=1 Tax=Pseudovibrio sp. Tun.PSC04-5.I4 TaxID=1798213 RepID=UPI0008916900|nr:phage tail protein I [Pseudovibrio sp. Tun.PSC04-5.I4]SDR07525.1 phage tail protein, P2 protein I family [Pseudovibrio sp. Tun.PSC04-5.I4]
MRDASSLLPKRSASEHDRRVASVTFWSVEIDQAIVDLRKLTNPDETPARYLPFLAYEASVDFWDEEWLEDVKRKAIRQSYIIHRFKGTIHAIEVALSIISVEAKLVEWWEVGGSGVPGTFEITAYPSGKVYNSHDYLSARLQKKIWDAVNLAKPLSRHFTFRLGIRATTKLTVGMVVSDLYRTRIMPPLTTQLNSMMPLGMGAAASTGERVQIRPWRPDSIESTGPFWAAAMIRPLRSSIYIYPRQT